LESGYEETIQFHKSKILDPMQHTV